MPGVPKAESDGAIASAIQDIGSFPEEFKASLWGAENANPSRTLYRGSFDFSETGSEKHGFSFIWTPVSS